MEKQNGNYEKAEQVWVQAVAVIYVCMFCPIMYSGFVLICRAVLTVEIL